MRTGTWKFCPELLNGAATAAPRRYRGRLLSSRTTRNQPRRCRDCRRGHPPDTVYHLRYRTCLQGGHEPRRRLVKPALVPSEAAVVEVTSAQLVAVVDTEPPAAASDPAQAATSLDPQGAAEPVVTDAWLAHRRLIRATLPRTAADPPPPGPFPSSRCISASRRHATAGRFDSTIRGRAALGRVSAGGPRMAMATVRQVTTTK